MMKKTPIFGLILTLFIGLAGCTVPSPTATVSPSPSPAPTRTEAPSPSATPSPTLPPTLTPTITLTPTVTLIPFSGFLDNFNFYRSWYNDDTTVFYFLNAGIDHMLYARADDLDLICEPDPQLMTALICVHDQKVEGESVMEFEFFTDPERTVSVFKHSYETGLANHTIYHNQFDCPLRGQNVTCESEYRLYDGICYYSHTCYDACGLYYSRDNLPTEFNEFQGFTGPCD